ncbi:MAG: hypothetical protein U1G08_18840 [Verrucomicrobiota bacterium]
MTFTKDLAREFTDRIKAAGADLASLLKRAHDGEAWKALGYDSWKSYCHVEFSFTKQRSYQLLALATARQSLQSTTVDLPTHEAQVRPMAHLPPEEQREVWKKAVEIGGGKPTGKQVQEAVQARTVSREEALSKLGVVNAPPLPEQEPEESKTLWSLKFHWGKAKKKEKAEFLSWVREIRWKEIEKDRAEAPDKPRRIKVEFNHGMHMWARAKGSLDQISDSDLALVEALEACLEYAHKRLTESRNGKVGGE